MVSNFSTTYYHYLIFDTLPLFFNNVLIEERFLTGRTRLTGGGQ